MSSELLILYSAADGSCAALRMTQSRSVLNLKAAGGSSSLVAPRFGIPSPSPPPPPWSAHPRVSSWSLGTAWFSGKSGLYSPGPGVTPSAPSLCGPAGKGGVSAAKGSGRLMQRRCLSREGSGRSRQRRCLSREGSGSTRQRRCLTAGHAP